MCSRTCLQLLTVDAKDRCGIEHGNHSEGAACSLLRETTRVSNKDTPTTFEMLHAAK